MSLCRKDISKSGHFLMGDLEIVADFRLFLSALGVTSSFWSENLTFYSVALKPEASKSAI